MYDYAIQSSNPALHPDHLHRCARLWGRCFWGEQYPDQEVLDDIENYRALELLHHGFCMRHRTWKVLVSPKTETDSPESLFQDFISIRDVHGYHPLRVIFSTANTVRNSPICLLPLNLPEQIRVGAPSTQYIWQSAQCMPTFYSIADCYV